MTRRAAPVLPLSGARSPSFLAALLTLGDSLGRRTGGNSSGREGMSVRLRARVDWVSEVYVCGRGFATDLEGTRDF
jgi:hypothetical protein